MRSQLSQQAGGNCFFYLFFIFRYQGINRYIFTPIKCLYFFYWIRFPSYFQLHAWYTWINFCILRLNYSLQYVDRYIQEI